MKTKYGASPHILSLFGRIKRIGSKIQITRDYLLF